MRRTAGLLALLLLAAAPAIAVDTNIYNIRTGAHSTGTLVTVGELTDVVVTASGRFGFCVQELVGLAPPPYTYMYCGLWVYTNGTHVGQLKKGDLVAVTGLTEEYFGLTEINVVTAGGDGDYAVVGSAPVPAPVHLRIADINDTGPFNEAFESILVRVDLNDPTLYARARDSFNEWYLSTSPTIGQGDSILIDSYSADPSPDGDFDYVIPPEGTLLSYVQGMLTYNYSKFKIAPRNCVEDLGMACAPALRGAWARSNAQVDVLFAVPVDPASAGNPNNYYFESPLAVLGAARDAIDPRLVHLTTSAQTPGTGDILYVEDVLSEGDLVPVPPNAQASFTQGLLSLYDIQYVPNVLQGNSPYNNKIVTTSGRVAAVDGNSYYLQEGDAGPFKHLYARVAPYGSLAVGDSVLLAGRVLEYFNSTYIGYSAGVQLWENLGPATSPVIAHPVTAGQIIYNAFPVTGQPWRPGNNLPEPWEDALVHLTTPVYADSVAAQAALYGEWWLLAGTDSCRTDIRHSLNDFGDLLSPRGLWVGDSLDMTGILRYEYTLYRLVPRDQSDIVILHSNMGVNEIPRDLLASLSQNHPNPFAGGTTLRFRLEDHATVSAEVFDVTGACVRRLLDRQPARAGEHMVHWDGRTDRGLRAEAGTYFYRLTVDGRSEARQMVRID